MSYQHLTLTDQRELTRHLMAYDLEAKGQAVEVAWAVPDQTLNYFLLIEQKSPAEVAAEVLRQPRKEN